MLVECARGVEDRGRRARGTDAFLVGQRHLEVTPRVHRICPTLPTPDFREDSGLDSRSENHRVTLQRSWPDKDCLSETRVQSILLSDIYNLISGKATLLKTVLLT